MNYRTAQNLAQTIEVQEYSKPASLRGTLQLNIVHMQEKSFEKLMAHREVYDELERRFGCVVAQWIFDRL